MQLVHGYDIYSNYEPDLGEDLQGWNSDHPVFEQMIAEIRPSVIIDVGVWKGRSSIYLAQKVRQYGLNCAVLSIDTFLGSSEHWLGRSNPVHFASLRSRYGMPRLYWQFLSNVVKFGVQDIVVPIPQTSTIGAEILASLGVMADLVHVDASHDHESVVSDSRAFWRILNPGGVLIGDDYVDVWPTVISAVQQFSGETGRDFEVLTPKWLMRKGPR